MQLIIKWPLSVIRDEGNLLNGTSGFSDNNGTASVLSIPGQNVLLCSVWFTIPQVARVARYETNWQRNTACCSHGSKQTKWINWDWVYPTSSSFENAPWPELCWNSGRSWRYIRKGRDNLSAQKDFKTDAELAHFSWTAKHWDSANVILYLCVREKNPHELVYNL